ncbi:hypothetical protein [Pantoea septica]|uniref:hypothetical protein n=1 Tax=Pantoea TaxID=53335 RepID=UPI002FD934ED
MLVNFDPLKLEEEHARSHPWGKTEYEERAGQYSNFITNPELITTMLEDFNPHEDKQAVQTFYDFLRWINGPDSQLETNDCALREGVIKNPDALFKFSHKIDGRVEILLRQHEVNCLAQAVTWLFRMLSLYLQVERPDFFDALIDLESAPTDFVLLPGDENSGHRIRITFNAYGNGEVEVWACLATVFQSIWNATKRLNSALSEGNNLTFP